MTDPAKRSLLRHPMAKWGLFMGLLFALWFGGWFVFARFADGKVADAIQIAGERGLDIKCSNRSMKGFPFRIGVHCDAVDVERRDLDLKVTAGALRTAAQLYAPGKMVVELDGPVTAQTPAETVEANWSMMRLFADGKIDGGFDLASVNFADLVAGFSRGNVSVKQGALHLRPTPPAGEDALEYRSLDFAGDLSALSLSSPGNAIPAMNIQVQATLIDGYADMITARQDLRTVLADGANLIVDKVWVSGSTKGSLALSGPVEISPDGLISGKVSIGISDAQALANELRSIDPNMATVIGGLGSAVAGMGQQIKFGDKELRAIAVTITNGVVKLGFIELARIPPLAIN